jgi:peroxiredoxin
LPVPELPEPVSHISVDSFWCHAAYEKSLGGLGFDLLADFHPKREVARKYGVWLEEKGFSGRAIFIVDKNGKIAYVKIHEILEQPENEVLLDALKRFRTS